jgi:hypothetical protein
VNFIACLRIRRKNFTYLSSIGAPLSSSESVLQEWYSADEPEAMLSTENIKDFAVFDYLVTTLT